jgi:hypothetical protein
LFLVVVDGVVAAAVFAKLVFWSFCAVAQIYAIAVTVS